ncbi:MAG TPA: hypothetical protein VGO67_05825 [Verrucomicrobiae bacterium]|jgi:hypothetical protein
MKIAPSRQQLIASAMVSILFGVTATLIVGWIYLRFNGTLNEISKTNAQGSVATLIRAFREVVFGVVPGICACLLGLSLLAVLYLTEESKKA